MLEWCSGNQPIDKKIQGSDYFRLFNSTVLGLDLVGEVVEVGSSAFLFKKSDRDHLAGVPGIQNPQHYFC